MLHSEYQIPEHMQGLVKAFTEMMLGTATPENLELIVQWSLYMHIRSVMPQLTSHWNQANPQDSEIIKAAIHELKTLNEQWKESRHKQG